MQTMKISARNMLKGKVKQIKPGAINSEVIQAVQKVSLRSHPRGKVGYNLPQEGLSVGGHEMKVFKESAYRVNSARWYFQVK